MMKAIAIWNESCVMQGQQRGNLEIGGDVTLYAFGCNRDAVSYVRHLLRQARKENGGHGMFVWKTARSIFRGIESADDLGDFEVQYEDGSYRAATTEDAVVM